MLKFTLEGIDEIMLVKECLFSELQRETAFAKSPATNPAFRNQKRQNRLQELLDKLSGYGYGM